MAAPKSYTRHEDRGSKSVASRRMFMISERLSVSHHHFEGYPQKVKTLSVDDSSLENSVNMLGTVYKICIICIVETLKLLGRTIIKATEGSSPKMVDRQPTSPSPRRSSSRIVLIRSIKIERNWLKSKNTQLQLANSGIQATEQR